MRQFLLVPLGALFLLFVAWVNLSILFDWGRDKEHWTARLDRWFEQRRSINRPEPSTDMAQDEGRSDQAGALGVTNLVSVIANAGLSGGTFWLSKVGQGVWTTTKLAATAATVNWLTVSATVISVTGCRAMRM